MTPNVQRMCTKWRPNIEAFEHMMRRMQLIEYFHREKLNRKNQAAVDISATLSPAESEAFLGKTRLSGTLMICPALEEHVSKELEREATILKQARKPREEQKQKK